ncbi:hypothetical protein Lal_00007606 [Lupinus albus]|uniref:Uncharacterized protein n=1 Tax=Lupinus albus TaxID=3870 RepID=A0A6A4P383_LUPAL|nr:hypothetical protein Lalb_Chr16g0383311 [Lupinus albus]KAF1874990.1 hypothetical protein Lal_00007606 [Lupinus albus]
MSSIFYVTLFLALVLCNASIDPGNEFNKAMDRIDDSESTNAIHVQLNLPSINSMKVHFKCTEGGSFDVATDKSYTWGAEIGEKCEVTYRNLSASIVARGSDDLNSISYWLIKLDGFYHSSDNKSWEIRVHWKIPQNGTLKSNAALI